MVFLGNAVIGGITAATRAALERKPVYKAFTLGMLGGAVHAAGKFIGPQKNLPTAIAAIGVSSAGISMISNAGSARDPFDELFIPVGMFRLRYFGQDGAKIRVAINAFETALFARQLAREGLVLDWDRSAQSGTFAFRTRGKEILSDGERVQGVALGSILVVSEFSSDLERTTRHEAVHVLQNAFLQEAWGRPIESYVGRRVALMRRIPAWLELGIVVPMVAGTEYGLYGKDGPVYRLRETEAQTLDRR